MTKMTPSNGDSPRAHCKSMEINSVPFPSKSENDPVFPCDPEDNMVTIAYVNSWSFKLFLSELIDVSRIMGATGSGKTTVN